MLDKQRLLADLRDQIDHELGALERQQRDAQEGSTHEESRAEHAKDTRATEQGYLARGLAERIEELRRTRAALESAKPKPFESDAPIAVMAIAILSEEGAPPAANEAWWIVAGAGGFTLEQEGVRVRTLTPVSPLGRALLGARAGDDVQLDAPKGTRHFRVVEVS